MNINTFCSAFSVLMNTTSPLLQIAPEQKIVTSDGIAIYLVIVRAMMPGQVVFSHDPMQMFLYSEVKVFLRENSPWIEIYVYVYMQKEREKFFFSYTLAYKHIHLNYDMNTFKLCLQKINKWIMFIWFSSIFVYMGIFLCDMYICFSNICNYLKI